MTTTQTSTTPQVDAIYLEKLKALWTKQEEPDDEATAWVVDFFGFDRLQDS